MKMEMHIQVNGIMIYLMEKEFIFLKMVKDMKDNFLKDKDM